MAVQQTECYRVVTIGYLKTFIGDLIQDSSNGSVIHISRTDDTYCPTYSELTGGTIIQTWDPGRYSPNGDRDGIVVNQTSLATSAEYASNQLVDQRDLSITYTRFSSLSIETGKISFSACGDSTTVSYSHKYIRYTKSMNDSCNTGTSSVEVSDTVCGELTWHPSTGTVSNCNTYTVDKNSSSSVIPITLYADVVFRDDRKYSNTVNMSQEALGGQWINDSTSYSISTSSEGGSYGCAGGSFSVAGTGTTVNGYYWRDSCGVDYPSITTGTTDTAYLGTESGSFSSWDCAQGSHTSSSSFTFTHGTAQKVVTFTQNCESCYVPPPPTPEPEPVPEGVDEYPKYPDSNYTTLNNEMRGTDNGTDIVKDRNTGEYYLHYVPLIAADEDGFPKYTGTDTDSVFITGPLYYCSDGECSTKTEIGSSWISFDNGLVQMRRVMYDDDHNPTGFAFDENNNRIAGLEIRYSVTPQPNEWYRFMIRLSARDGGEVMRAHGTPAADTAYGRTATEWNWTLWIPPSNCNVDTCHNGECHSGWAHC